MVLLQDCTKKKKEKERRKSVFWKSRQDRALDSLTALTPVKFDLARVRGVGFPAGGIDFAWKMAESLKVLVDRRRDKGELRKEKRARETAKQIPRLRKSRGTRICGYRLTSSSACRLSLATNSENLPTKGARTRVNIVKLRSRFDNCKLSIAGSLALRMFEITEKFDTERRTNVYFFWLVVKL